MIKLKRMVSLDHIYDQLSIQPNVSYETMGLCVMFVLILPKGMALYIDRDLETLLQYGEECVIDPGRSIIDQGRAENIPVLRELVKSPEVMHSCVLAVKKLGEAGLQVVIGKDETGETPSG